MDDEPGVVMDDELDVSVLEELDVIVVDERESEVERVVLATLTRSPALLAELCVKAGQTFHAVHLSAYWQSCQRRWMLHPRTLSCLSRCWERCTLRSPCPR